MEKEILLVDPMTGVPHEVSIAALRQVGEGVRRFSGLAAVPFHRACFLSVHPAVPLLPPDRGLAVVRPGKHGPGD